MTHYPHEPGHTGMTPETLATSAEAAEAIAPHRARLAMIALQTVARLKEATRFEAIAHAGVPACALAPRFSELIRAGLLEPTGARRPNPETGKTGAALRLTDRGRLVAMNIQGGAA